MAQAVTKWNDLDLASIAFSPDLVKVGNVYTAPFEHKLVIQTPLAQASAPLVGEDGEALEHLLLEAVGPLSNFIEQFEQALKDAATGVHLKAWFPRTEPDVTLAGFKSAVLTSSNVLKLRAHPLPEVYVKQADGPQLATPAAVVAGARLQAVIEATCVSFGRTQWGCAWRVLQILVHPAPPQPRCLITLDDSEVLQVDESLQGVDHELQ